MVGPKEPQPFLICLECKLANQKRRHTQLHNVAGCDLEGQLVLAGIGHLDNVVWLARSHIFLWVARVLRPEVTYRERQKCKGLKSVGSHFFILQHTWAGVSLSHFSDGSWTGFRKLTKTKMAEWTSRRCENCWRWWTWTWTRNTLSISSRYAFLILGHCW